MRHVEGGYNSVKFEPRCPPYHNLIYRGGSRTFKRGESLSRGASGGMLPQTFLKI